MCACAKDSVTSGPLILMQEQQDKIPPGLWNFESMISRSWGVLICMLYFRINHYTTYMVQIFKYFLLVALAIPKINATVSWTLTLLLMTVWKWIYIHYTHAALCRELLVHISWPWYWLYQVYAGQGERVVKTDFSQIKIIQKSFLSSLVALPIGS